MTKEKQNDEPVIIISEEKDLQFTLEGGSKFTFKHFVPKEENLIKINLTFGDGDNGEGIWCCVSDEDLRLHDSHITDSKMCRAANMRNTSMSGPIWGEYIPFRMNGQSRPVCNVSGLNGNKCKRIFNQIETVSFEPADQKPIDDVVSK